MPQQNDQQVAEFFQKVVQDLKVAKKIESINYRGDSQDYQIIFDDRSHAELREKIIEQSLANNRDARKEVEFRIKHAPKFEEWEE